MLWASSAGRTPRSVHSHLGPFCLPSSPLCSELLFLPKPPCFLQVHMSAVLSSGRDTTCPPAPPHFRWLLGMRGTGRGRFWATTVQPGLFGADSSHLWAQPVKTGQGDCLCGSVGTRARRLADPPRARETCGPGSALCPRKDLAPRG